MIMDTRKQRNAELSSDEWYTPKWILDTLGEFDLDPCSPEERPFDTAKYDAQLKRLRNTYEESNKILLPGTKVRVTSLQRYKNIEVKEGIILGYWSANETSPLCYEVKFPVNTRRVFEVESNEYKIEEVKE